mmetsp:Transcript_5897/g.19252  ORF Transcript_5897/g.19252 Transcript_5897/m.19252 type:complete len:283 (-) Transcript_5897:323-1171(-)
MVWNVHECVTHVKLGLGHPVPLLTKHHCYVTNDTRLIRKRSWICHVLRARINLNPHNANPPLSQRGLRHRRRRKMLQLEKVDSTVRTKVSKSRSTYQKHFGNAKGGGRPKECPNVGPLGHAVHNEVQARQAQRGLRQGSRRRKQSCHVSAAGKEVELRCCKANPLASLQYRLRYLYKVLGYLGHDKCIRRNLLLLLLLPTSTQHQHASYRPVRNVRILVNLRRSFSRHLAKLPELRVTVLPTRAKRRKSPRLLPPGRCAPLLRYRDIVQDRSGLSALSGWQE